jgi:glucose/arabinose dehydrogenase
VSRVFQSSPSRQSADRSPRAGEGGLLGIAVDPRFAENRRLFLYATVPQNGRTVNRLTRWVLSADGR